MSTRKPFHALRHKRVLNALAPLSLGELQLLQLGLWVIGEQDRVDRVLLKDWRLLVAQLKHATEDKVRDAARAHRGSGRKDERR